MRPIRLAAAFFAVGAWTFASRILGFVRDVLIAAFLGAGPVAEAFLIAFALPNMFRRFFAEGAFNTAFVPLYAKKLEAGEDADGFASDAMSALAGVLVIFTAIAIPAMPFLVLAMAGGFADDSRMALAVGYGRIVFVYILFISLAALVSGALNASGRFWTAAAAPVLLNVILVTVLVASAGAEDVVQGRWLAWGVVAAGMAQLGFVWVAAFRAGLGIRLRRPRWTPELKRLAIIAAPAALAGGVVQVNLLVGRQVASWFDGAIAWLNYADRLYQLPLGVVGIAIGVVLLPDLSRRLRAGDDAGGRQAFNRAGELSLALTLPAAVALMVIAEPLVSVLFQRGAFGAEDVAPTAAALVVYGAGLPAFVLQKVLQPLYFAREDTRTPFRYAVASMLVNAGVAIGLAPLVGFLAAALGTTLAAWAMVWLLWRGARGMGQAAALDERFRRRIIRILAAALVMGAAIAAAAAALEPWLAAPGWRYGALALLVGLGGAVYFAAAHLFGGLRLGEVRAAFRR
jgi:putative peptidoglycan lipid II flippase